MSGKIQYKKLDADCFNAHSLDSFVRHQTVNECWREVDQKWVLVPNYVELVCFQISEEYRHRGIGRKLFAMICEEAIRLGADKLYISGHSSKESQAAYRALGCKHAEEINEVLAAEEPFDVQLEYALWKRPDGS